MARLEYKGGLSPDQLAVLAALDDVWVYFDELQVGLPRKKTAAILRGLVRLNYVDSRRNDVPGQGGRVEYAITEKGDTELQR